MAELSGFRALASALSVATGHRCDPAPSARLSGGSIHACYRWDASGGPLFVKVADLASRAVLEAEAQGLRQLAAAQAVRVPEVLGEGIADQACFLALEWIEPGTASAACETALGERLAAVHRVQAPRFGWHRDNAIGRTPQLNGWRSDWSDFYGTQRLRPQLALAVRNGLGRELQARGELLLEHLPALLAGHRPAPSLLHGDLWGGNWCADRSGEPVIFDPATYFGDREADIAMTRLFGGFGRRFYEAYEASWPLPSGHAERRDLYNLYHVLNHANLFGAGYVRQAREMTERLLARAGP